jgi:hypothetical protein
MYWPELRGQSSMTTVTEGETGVSFDEFGAPFFAKITWLIVMKSPDKDYSICM